MVTMGARTTDAGGRLRASPSRSRRRPRGRSCRSRAAPSRSRWRRCPPARPARAPSQPARAGPAVAEPGAEHASRQIAPASKQRQRRPRAARGRPGATKVLHHQGHPPVEHVERRRPRSPAPSTVRLRWAPPRTRSREQQRRERRAPRRRRPRATARRASEAERDHGGGRRAHPEHDRGADVGAEAPRRKGRGGDQRDADEPKRSRGARSSPRARLVSSQAPVPIRVSVVRIASSSLPIPKKRTPPPGFGPSTEKAVSGEPATTSTA